MIGGCCGCSLIDFSSLISCFSVQLGFPLISKLSNSLYHSVKVFAVLVCEIDDSWKICHVMSSDNVIKKGLSETEVVSEVLDEFGFHLINCIFCFSFGELSLVEFQQSCYHKSGLLWGSRQFSFSVGVIEFLTDSLKDLARHFVSFSHEIFQSYVLCSYGEGCVKSFSQLSFEFFNFLENTIDYFSNVIFSFGSINVITETCFDSSNSELSSLLGFSKQNLDSVSCQDCGKSWIRFSKVITLYTLGLNFTLQICFDCCKKIVGSIISALEYGSDFIFLFGSSCYFHKVGFDLTKSQISIHNGFID